MDCCKKEEDCCPCKERIECLQAQINQLTEMNDTILFAITEVYKEHATIEDSNGEKYFYNGPKEDFLNFMKICTPKPITK